MKKLWSFVVGVCVITGLLALFHYARIPLEVRSLNASSSTECTAEQPAAAASVSAYFSLLQGELHDYRAYTAPTTCNTNDEYKAVLYL